MLVTNTNITWYIRPEDVWNYFLENKEDLRGNMHIVCKHPFDDDDTEWWLFVTLNFDSDNMLLSLEDCDTIIDSRVVDGPEGVTAAIKELLAKIN